MEVKMVNTIWRSVNPKIENIVVLFISFISIILSGISPDITLFGMVVFPIPILLLYLKVDKIKFSIFSGLMVLASLVVNGFWGTFSCCVGTILVGVVAAEAIKRGKNGVAIVKALTLTIMIAVSIIGFVFLIKTGESLNKLLDDAQKSYEQRIDSMAQLYRDNNMSEDIVKQLLQYKSQFDINEVVNQLPYIVAFSSLIMATITYLLMRMVLSEASIKLPQKAGFGYFYFSNLYGAFLIGIFSIGIIFKSFKFQIGDVISYGAMSILMYSLILNAYATIYYFLKKKFNFNGALILAILVLSSFLVGNVTVAITGFAEMMLNFRHLDPHSLRKVKKEH